MVKLLIGFDGSPGGIQAVTDLTRTGLPAEGVEAIVMSTLQTSTEYPPFGASAAGRELDAWLRRRVESLTRQSQRVASQGARRIAELFPGWRVVAEAAEDTSVWALIRKADAWPAELFSVGSSGRGPLGRLMFGSVARSAVLYAQCTVRVGRTIEERPVSSNGPVRVVVAWDGSAGASLAVRAASRRRWPPHSEGRIVTALDAQLVEQLLTQPDSAGDSTKALDELRRGAEAAVQELRGAGLVVGEPLMLTGNPRRLVLNASEAWGADCIFVGATGRSRVQRMLMGSVSSTVAARARCSVEVVRSNFPDRV